MTGQNNVFDGFPEILREEAVTILARGQDVRIERIVSTGHVSREGFWYDQDEHEWVVVLKGQATLAFDDGESIQMIPGDFVNIPAHRKHRVKWTTPDEPTVWLAIFYRN